MSRTSDYRRYREYLHKKHLERLMSSCPSTVWWNDYRDRKYLKIYYYGDKFYKRASRRKIRKLDSTHRLPKGNISNKYYDYWWTIT